MKWFDYTVGWKAHPITKPAVLLVGRRPTLRATPLALRWVENPPYDGI
ncbi:MAG: hypothetical protein IKZ88_01925 [Neisseriaceae bacterium]|nr:hypothetical protein [Neisseriaceae bacterium]